MATAINAVQAYDCILDAIKARAVGYLKGHPGIGKSALIRKIAEDYNLKLIDLRLASYEPVDFTGFPIVNKDAGRSSYLPFDTFPLVGDEIPKGYSGWLLFLDELPAADRSVLKAVYKLILDRMVGQHKLHDNVAIVAAGNLESSNAIVEEIGTALASRMIHYELRVDYQPWIEWATNNGIHRYITAFIQWKPEMLYKFDPKSIDDTFPCPRTWDFASRFVQQRENDLRDPILLHNLAGTIGEGTAREFLGYCQVFGSLPSKDDLVRSPQTVPVPSDRSVIWALTSSIAYWATDHIVGPLLEYVNRLPREFQIVTLRELVRRHPKMRSNEHVTKWQIANAAELF